MRQIHVFREPRMGGSLFMGYLVSSLNVLDTSIINYGHDITKVLELQEDPNVFVIRCDRKNLTEHFLSMYSCNLMSWNFTNITYDTPTNKFFDELRSKRVTISKIEVIQYVTKKIKDELLYSLAVKKFNHQTIYYEDMFSPFDIPSLELFNIDLSNEMRYTKKLPDYKREVFINYDQIPAWIDEIKDDYIKKHNLTKLLEHWPSHSGCQFR